MPAQLTVRTGTHPTVLDPIEAATRRQFITGLGASALALAFLAACGDDDAEGDGGGATVTIDDYFGPVTIPAEPKKVVAAESVTLGNMLALKVKPVGASVNLNSLPGYLADQMDGVEDLTTADGNQIDIERALSLGADLIVTFAGSKDDAWNKEQCDKYKAAMATFCYQYGYTYIEELELNLNETARALNAEAEAKRVIEAYDKRIADLKKRVTAASLTDKPVTVVRVFMAEGLSIRIGTSESIAFRALGIAQPEGQRNPDDFSIDISTEQVQMLNTADTVYVYVDDNATTADTAFLDSPVWKSLTPVKNNRVHTVNSGIWNSVDLVGLMKILDDIERTFIAPAEKK